MDFVTEFQQRLVSLIQRKRKHFSDVKRLVMDWDLVEMGTSFHLNVVSTLLNGDVDTKEIEAKLGKHLESAHSAHP